MQQKPLPLANLLAQTESAWKLAAIELAPDQSSTGSGRVDQTIERRAI
jgi:hypothetical protein